MRAGSRDLSGDLPQRADVVEHPDAASVRGHDEVVLVKSEIAHRAWRQVELQRLPVVAVVERHEDAELGAGHEQAAPLRILLHRLQVDAARQPRRDLLPAPAAISGAIDIRLIVLETVAVDGRVGFIRVEVRRLQHHHLAPPRQLARRHVRPRLPIVLGDVNVAVVGADPEERRADGGRRDRVDDAAPLEWRRVGGGRRVEIRRHARILPRHVLADARPVIAAVGRLEQILIAEIQRVRIGRRKDEGHGPRVPRRGRQVHLRRHVVGLACLHVASRHRAAEEDVRIQGIGRGVARLAAGARRLPVAHGDPGEPPARPDTHGAAVLLRAGHPVRKRVVRRDPVDLRRGLVQPRAPRRVLAEPLHRDDRALIAAENHAVAVRRIDPELMVVVTAGRSLERLAERSSAIARSVHAGVRYVHEILILRIDGDLAEVPSAAPDAAVARCLAPRRTGIVGPEEAAFLRIDDRVQPAAVRGGCGDADAADPVGRQTAGELMPVRAAVGRLVQPAARTVRRRINAPGRTTGVPERGVNRLRIARIEGQIDRADVVALEEHLLPRGAAVTRSVDATVRVRAVHVAERRHEDDVGILRMDDDLPDLPRVVEAEVRPGPARVGRLVHSVAVRDLRPHVGFARAHVDDVRVRRGDRDGSDRGDGLRVEYRQPGAPRVRRLPHAAADGAEVERVRLTGHAAHPVDAPAPERPDQPPAQPGIQAGVVPRLLRDQTRQRAGRERGGKSHNQQNG